MNVSASDVALATGLSLTTVQQDIFDRDFPITWDNLLSYAFVLATDPFPLAEMQAVWCLVKAYNEEATVWPDLPQLRLSLAEAFQVDMDIPMNTPGYLQPAREHHDKQVKEGSKKSVGGMVESTLSMLGSPEQARRTGAASAKRMAKALREFRTKTRRALPDEQGRLWVLPRRYPSQRRHPPRKWAVSTKPPARCRSSMPRRPSPRVGRAPTRPSPEP